MQLLCDGAVSPTVSDCISRLRENENLEDTPSASAQSLGELKRPYLTPVEEKLLGFIEKEYGIIDEVVPSSR
ncbi:hypothetical protein [Nostoc sp. CHAB 5715]|uniref:hypothetical protein n=1 Tax=Nostoc sp. CHAB 5715 TaxID=2780400 RepID=UPI001E62B5D1|nr:hypothetical protein [Nostoc sp. CHAB 5715]MCC5622155.1 hypothetical protein [Nostoc sp. CHAB 5715]